MKSTTASSFAIFAFLAVAPVIGGESVLVLPNGNRVVVPSLETSGYENSFEVAHKVFRDAIAECEANCTTDMLRSIAEYLSMVRSVSTNNFTQESLEAIRKDDQLEREGKIPHSPVLMGRRTTPNVSAVRRRHRRIMEWNRSIIDARRGLLTMALPPLKKHIERLDKADRRHYVESFIKKACLNTDEEDFIFKQCDELGRTDDVVRLYGPKEKKNEDDN